MRAMGQYQQLTWQDRDGLLANGVGAIAQTPDRYLWLGTAEGLVRFDGVRFTTFDRTNTAAIKNNDIHSLLVDRTGALWIGSHAGGVTRYQAGRFTDSSTADGLADLRAYCLLKDDRVTTYSTRDGLPSHAIRSLARDHNGVVWVGTDAGLSRFEDGRFTITDQPEGVKAVSIKTLAVDDIESSAGTTIRISLPVT